MITIYGLKTCDTCRLAGRELEASTSRDIRATPLSASEIARFATAFGDALINRRSTTWRNVPEAERTWSSADLIAKYPTVMKRPVIDGPAGLTLGWNKDIAAQHRDAAPSEA